MVLPNNDLVDFLGHFGSIWAILGPFWVYIAKRHFTIKSTFSKKAFKGGGRFRHKLNYFWIPRQSPPLKKNYRRKGEQSYTK